ncbi:MAG: aryl-sulfate sulfotransferase [Chloroflexota bacterium]|nr:aryl-sulfate sulfotransferase [Chloroflexota bacterium]
MTIGAGAFGAASVFGLEACSKRTAPHATATAPAPQPSPTPLAYRGLHTRPDLNGAPQMQVRASTGTAQSGYLFLTPTGATPTGPAIYDNSGALVWYRPVNTEQAHNLQVLTYEGRQMLAWFEGSFQDPGWGEGEYVLYDGQYRQVTRVRAGNGVPLDLHAFVVTPQGTALVDTYTPVILDLTQSGGAARTSVLDCLIQEVDIASGAVLFSWHALDHIGLGESLMQPPTKPGQVYDFFHLNSIDVDTDGNLLVSARNTSTLYKLDRKTGGIIWRLSGATGATRPSPHLTLQPGSESFWYQHDARRNPDGTISIFDDGGAPYHHPGRGLVFDMDEQAGTATVDRAYGAGLGIHIEYQGSCQRQPNGNWLIGWGDVGRVTEFTPSGEICLDLAFPGNSYRSLRFDWQGRPAEPPAVAAARGANGATNVWASWNGATDIDRWRVLSGADSQSLEPAATFPWRDLETDLSLQSAAAAFAVEALDSAGNVLGRSATVTV